ncbi:MAG: DUF885 family protein [Pseudomonadota bacterium]
MKPAMVHLRWLAFPVMAAILSACGNDSESLQLDRRTLVEAEAILEDVTRTELGLSPQTATLTGLANMAPQGSALRLDDHSQAGFERARLIRIDLLKRLMKSPDMPSRHPLARDLVVLSDGVHRLNILQQIGHGRLGPAKAYPYSIDAVSGIWRDGPYLLRYEQPVSSAEDAEAWLSRLTAIAGAYDDTRRRLIADSAVGHVPPKLVLEDTAASLNHALEEADTYGRLAFTFENLLASTSRIDRQAANQFLSQATDIIDQRILPAHDALAQTVASLIEDAPQLPGLSGQPSGYETWRALIAWHSPGLLESEDPHLAHLAVIADRQAALETIVDRIPAPLSEDGDGAASAILLTEADQIAALAPHVEEEVETLSEPGNETTPLPAPGLRSVGLSQRQTDLAHRLNFGSGLVPAARDGRRPNLILTNPEDDALWPEWWRAYHLNRLNAPSLRDYLESWNEAAKRSPARLLFQNTDFALGWEAYAAAFSIQASGEPPALKDVYLLAKFELIIAALAAVDTGIHTQRWSLDEAMAFMAETTSLPADLNRQLVTQIASRPGEASARLHGQRRFRSLEQRARAVLTSRFDAADFRYTLLNGGPRPFFLVETDVERWYEGQIER